jgi:hypothetical protein
LKPDGEFAIDQAQNAPTRTQAIIATRTGRCHCTIATQNTSAHRQNGSNREINAGDNQNKGHSNGD